MSTQTLAADKIRTRGVSALVRELGPAGMVQFIQQFRHGRGDYTKSRRKSLGDLSVDQIVDEIQQKRRGR
ncbi:MAG: hypothetical protein ACI9OU_001684 [Candidatus Promineifilaceae bacterium]|jgi:hypothetical protein